MRTIAERSAFPIRLRAWLGAAVTLGACLGADAALAAKVYRCGNVFQDLPCEAAKPAGIRPADKAAVPRDAPTPAPTRPAAQAGATDRLVLDPAPRLADVRR